MQDVFVKVPFEQTSTKSF